VKSHESPYATFANNPIWFVDLNGADTTFADNKARKDFNVAYGKVKNTISSNESNIAGYKNDLKQSDLKKRQIKKLNINISKAEYKLANWNKLLSDFTTIINSPVDFIYSSDISHLPEGFDGETGSPNDKLWEDSDRNITGGRIYIYIKGGRDNLYAHENRHGNQRLERKGLTKLQRETAGFLYQKIYDSQIVKDFIRNQRDQKYHGWKPATVPKFDLEDAIKYKIP
jgi:hypothetical protein